MLYGAISFTFAYYGEMITYLGMTAPMAVFALISWLRNPYNGNKAEVKVNRLKRKEMLFMILLQQAFLRCILHAEEVRFTPLLMRQMISSSLFYGYLHHFPMLLICRWPFVLRYFSQMTFTDFSVGGKCSSGKRQTVPAFERILFAASYL